MKTYCWFRIIKNVAAKKAISHSSWRRRLFLVSLVLGCFALSQTARAVDPPPDGGYPGANTAEGEDALLSLTFGSNNTAIGYHALLSNTTGFDNTASGYNALGRNATGPANTAMGFDALGFNTTGQDNTANGHSALLFNTAGYFNTANGASALFRNTTGNFNTADGAVALVNTTGSSNIALGYQAGQNLTTGDNNIDIGNRGGAGESNTVRIGTQGTQTATFIAGISGTAVMGGAVKVNAAGQLGTVPSSQRFKTDIKPMDKASEAILALKPVAFRYKQEVDPDGTPQFGLVAEDVEKVNPNLVARDTKGQIYTVRYDAVNAMLLNEFLKEHQTVQELKSAAVKQEMIITNQQKQIETLRAGLQKVNAQLETGKAAPKMVVSNQ
jgi:hypothetical protein